MSIPRHPVSQCAINLQRFLLNQDIATGTARTDPSIDKENFHALGLKKVVISAGIPPLPLYPQAVIQPQVEQDRHGLISGELRVVVITDRVREDQALLDLQDLSLELRRVVAKFWASIGPPVQLDDSEKLSESQVIVVAGGSFEGQDMPPVQVVSISIPIRLLTGRH